MTRQTIGGRLDLAALSKLAGDPDRDRMRHFHQLDHTQQVQAIHRLAAAGMSDHGIAQATALSVEFVRRLLGERSAEVRSA